MSELKIASDLKSSGKSKGPNRDVIIDSILKKLNAIDFKSDIPNIDVAIEIEKGCFTETINRCKSSPEAYIRNWSNKVFVEIYSERCAVIITNIKNSSYMMKKLTSGEWKPADIGLKKADDLDPESSALTKEYLKARSQQGVKQKIQEIYKCPKCSARKHTPPEGKQTRGLDEQQAQFVTCLVEQCGTRFRVG